MLVQCHVCNNVYNVQCLARKLGIHNMWVQHLEADMLRK